MYQSIAAMKRRDVSLTDKKNSDMIVLRKNNRMLLKFLKEEILQFATDAK